MNRFFALSLLLTFPGILTAGDQKKPIKVFVLAGQSNMEGKAKVALLEYQLRQQATRELFKHLKNDGKWIERPQAIGKIIPLVLARLGIRMLQSDTEGEDPN